MARCDQYIGLNNRAVKWLDENINDSIGEVVGISKFPYFSMFDYDESTGMLGSYKLKNGEVVHEKEQCAPWSSGPMHFIAIAKEDGEFIPETLWTDEEIYEQ